MTVLRGGEMECIGSVLNSFLIKMYKMDSCTCCTWDKIINLLGVVRGGGVAFDW